MHVLYISQYFPPEMGAPSARVHELAREWAGMGHRVTVLTGFAHHPVGVKAREDRWRLTRRETRDGIEVVRSYVYAAANKGTALRMLSYASFMASATVIGAARVRGPDIVVATSPQLLCAAAGYALARFFRVPFVFEVRDLWPETIIAIDAMEDNLVVRSLRSLARFLYNHCDRIVTVGEGYSRGINTRYGIPLEKITAIPNGIDTALFIPGPRDNELRREYGWGDKFVILYIGTMGMCQGLGQVVEAAARLHKERDLLFVFVGEGAEKDGLKQTASSLKLDNVQFIDQQPKSRVPLFYAACDLGVVTLRNRSLFEEVLPSKIFEYLGMERPLLLSVGGEARKLVEDAGAGEYVPSEDVEKLVEAIIKLRGQKERLAEMGKRGRQYVLAHYDRRRLAHDYIGVMEALINKEPPPGSRTPEQ
jgi:glycosyltransferase involved in cell wall biosynthesis